MKYFITGATGFAGSALAKKMREAGHDHRQTSPADSSNAKRELGFATRPFREGFEEILRHEMKLP